MKFLFTFLLFANSLFLVAQSVSKESYSQKEQFKFMQIHQYVLDNPFDVISSMKKHAINLNMSEKRFTEIFSARSKGEKIQLTKKEAMKLEKLKQLMLEDKKQHDKELARFIKSQNMEFSRYRQIEKRFHSNSKFQAEINKLSKK